jgi:hypothetical protein
MMPPQFPVVKYPSGRVERGKFRKALVAASLRDTPHVPVIPLTVLWVTASPSAGCSNCKDGGHETGKRLCSVSKMAENETAATGAAVKGLAESWGFEPQRGFESPTRLAGEHLRPLGQLSA